VFLSVVHLRELRCTLCSNILAQAGARSFIVDAQGDPVHFSPENSPDEMVVEITCANGHITALNIPSDVSVEESMMTPDEAPIGKDAVLRT
jgi:hypothetical protein